MRNKWILGIALTMLYVSVFSQINKTVVVKELEGLKISYTIDNQKQDCIFYIDNTSLNHMKVAWNVKLFYGKNGSKAFDHKLIVKPNTKLKIYAEDTGKTTGNAALQDNLKKEISKIEIHNVDIKYIEN